MEKFSPGLKVALGLARSYVKLAQDAAAQTRRKLDASALAEADRIMRGLEKRYPDILYALRNAWGARSLESFVTTLETRTRDEERDEAGTCDTPPTGTQVPGEAFRDDTEKGPPPGLKEG